MVSQTHCKVYWNMQYSEIIRIDSLNGLNDLDREQIRKGIGIDKDYAYGNDRYVRDRFVPVDKNNNEIILTKGE